MRLTDGWGKAGARHFKHPRYPRSQFTMTLHLPPLNSREIIYRLSKRRRGVAFLVWLFFAVTALIYLLRNFDLYGTAYLRDWVDVSGYVTDPILIALLVYVALRALERGERAESVAQAIVSNAPVGIFATDREGRVTFANAMHLQLMGETSLTQATGLIIQDLPTIKGTILEKTFRDALRGKPFSLQDFEYTSIYGKTSYLSAHGVPLRDPEGNLDGVMVLLEDTSERRRWQKELEAREQDARRQAREVEILHDISVAVTSTLELDEILRLVYERVSSATNTNTFFIALHGEPENELRFEFLTDNGIIMPKHTQRLANFGGLSGWILAHKEPMLARDLHDAHSLPAQPGALGSMSRSFLGVPLIVKDRAIGVMSVQSYAVGQFDQEHLRLLTAIANQISIVIENARLFSQTRAQAEEFRVANDIARAINSTLDLDQVLNLFFDRVNGLFNVEAGSLVLLDAQTNELVFEVVHGGAGASLLHKRMRSDKGIVGWVTLRGESVLVEDVRQDARWFSEMDATTQFVTRSILAAPIRVQDRSIGAIELINRRNGNPFTDSDRKLLEMFAVSAGIAIENARLHRQTQQRLGEVSMLNTIANQLASSLELEEILGAIVAHLQSLFKCRAVSIHLLNADKNFLELMASAGLAPERPFKGILIGRGIAGRVAQNGALHYVRRVEDAPADARLNPATQSLLTLPLASREQILGTLSLDSAQTNAFTEEDQHLLTIVAAQIGAAVENAQLYADLKERAASLKQAYDELKVLDQLKTEFTQNVSHELRTPLTFVKGYVELLRSDSLGAMTPKAREALDVVAAKTDALIHLVAEILSLQQVEAGRLQMDQVQLDQLAHAAVRGATASAQEAEIELREEIAPDVPPVAGDPERLAQVLDNLLSNAIKFSPSGGEVCVRVRAVNGDVRVDVQDNGIGIPKDKLDRIFDRFYQVDGSTTRRFGGTGLGLAIVKRIVELHHGRVWAESGEGKGSTFSFVIPIPDKT